jgi:hypothetical protein
VCRIPRLITAITEEDTEDTGGMEAILSWEHLHTIPGGAADFTLTVPVGPPESAMTGGATG